MPKNVLTTTQLHSLHMLARWCSKSSMWIKNFQCTSWALKRQTRDQFPRFTGSWIKQGSSIKNIYFCFNDCAKSVNCMDHNKLWTILRWEDQTTLPVFWEMYKLVKKQQLEPYMDQWTSSKLGKEYIKAVYCPSAYLTYMQSTSYEMRGWMKHKLESRLLGEISTTSDMHMIPSNGRQWKGTKEPLNENEREGWKNLLETQHKKKIRSWHLVPSLHDK